VIYSFMSLLLEFIGGPGNVEAFCRDRIIHGTFLHGTCCFPPMQVWHRLLSPPAMPGLRILPCCKSKCTT
jgi:hypothetical protein